MIMSYIMQVYNVLCNDYVIYNASLVVDFLQAVCPVSALGRGGGREGRSHPL